MDGTPSPAPLPTIEPKLIVITGNIGSGKTTLMSRLSDALTGIEGIRFVYESWTGEDSLLQDFIGDPRAYCYPFHMSIVEHYGAIGPSNPVGTRIVIVERSPEDCRSVFLPENSHHMDGSQMERCVDGCREVMTGSDMWRNRTTIMLSVGSEECMARILKRARGREVEYDASYIERLANRMEGMKRDMVLSNTSYDEMERNVSRICEWIKGIVGKI